MVLGHVSSSPIELRAYIFSFHMPLFFIANAFFIKKYDIKSSFTRSFKSLIVPYIIIATLTAVIAIFITEDDSIKVLTDEVIAILFSTTRTPRYLPYVEGIWAIWFITCLFLARNLFILINRIGEKTHFILAIIISVVLFIIGYYIGTTGDYMPWSFDIAFVSLIFMWFGNIIQKTRFLEKKIIWIITPISLLFWIVLVYNGFWIEMAVKEYRGDCWCFIAAIMGCIVFIALSKLIEKIKLLSTFLSWAGKNSMIILGFHNIDTKFFNWTANYSFGFAEEYAWIMRFIVQISITLIFTFVYLIIKKLIKKLFQ